MLTISLGQSLCTFSLLIWIMGMPSVKGDIGIEFLKEPTTVMVKPELGKMVHFRCTVSPSLATIEWLQSGQKIDPYADDTFLVQTHRLSVKLNRHILAAGLYIQCLAHYKGQSRISQPAKLVEAVLLLFDHERDLNVTVIAGNTAVVPCSLPYSVPTALTEFEFEDIRINKTKDRFILQPSGNLQILEAQTSDSGSYRCIAHNPFLAERKWSKNRVHLHVVPPVESKLELTFIPPHLYTTVMGTNIALECSAGGYPKPNVTWHRKNGQLPHNRSEEQGGNLLIHSVRKKDEGLYICEAHSLQGTTVTAQTNLEVQETPQIVKPPRNKRAEEGESISMDCSTRGQPKPIVEWFHNGHRLSENSRINIKENKLVLHHVKPHHSGIYQCFASNELGTINAASQLTVISSEKAATNLTEDKSQGHHHHHRKNQREENHEERKKHKGMKHKGGKHKGVKLVPPTRPEVSRFSDHSVMVRWDAAQNEGLPILFFKVQYRQVGKKPADGWSTVDADIPSNILFYEVTGLKTGAKYRFRIAAVYSNSDNKIGPKSDKFLLVKDVTTKQPHVGPAIIGAKAESPSAITITWEYYYLDSILIDGFIIYYRATHVAGDYSRAMVRGFNVRSHTISHLLAETLYDVKMQSYNEAGSSEFSNIYTTKTMASEISSQEKKKEGNPELQRVIPVMGSSNMSPKNRLLYIVLGVALGIMVIALIVFLVHYVLNRKERRRRGVETGPDVTVVPKSLNGHNRSKVNINVNPMAEIELDKSFDGIYPLVLQYREVPSNNNEVILLTTLERNREGNREEPNGMPCVNAEDSIQCQAVISAEVQVETTA